MPACPPATVNGAMFLVRSAGDRPSISASTVQLTTISTIMPVLPTHAPEPLFSRSPHKDYASLANSDANTVHLHNFVTFAPPATTSIKAGATSTVLAASSRSTRDTTFNFWAPFVKAVQVITAPIARSADYQVANNVAATCTSGLAALLALPYLSTGC